MEKALNYVNHFSQNAPARSKLKSFYFWGRDLKTHLLSCSIILRYCSYNITHNLLPSINHSNWVSGTEEWFKMVWCFNSYLIIQNNLNKT